MANLSVEELAALEAVKQQRAASAAPSQTEPLTGVGEEYGSFLGTLGAGIETSWDAFIAANSPKEQSGYANRKLGKSLEELKKHEAKADMFTQVGAGLTRYSPAIGISLLPVPGARIAGAAVGGVIAAFDALTEQAREGVPLNTESAMGAGAVTAALDLATGGAARLAKTPVKRFFAERTGEALTGAGSQAAINVSADKDFTDNLGTAALFSAGAGAGLTGVGKGLKRLNPWGEGAVKDSTAVEGQVGKVLPEDFKNSAIDQENKVFNKIEELKGSKSREDAEDIASDIVTDGVTGGTDAAILAALRKFEGGELVPHAFDVDVAEGLSGSGPTRNLAEMFGISKEDIKKSGDITLDARRGAYGKEIEGDNTRPKDEFAFKKFYDGRMADINNVFKDNANFATSLKKKYDREDRSAAEYQAVEDLGIALRNLRDGAKEGSEDFIAENAQKALARATELGVIDDLKGFSGKAGEFDPIHDIRARRIFDQIADKRLPGVRNINPDARAKGGEQAGPSAGKDLTSLVGKGFKLVGRVFAPNQSQKKLRDIKEKSKALTQSLTSTPKKPSQKLSDEPTVQDASELEAELEAARMKAEEAVQAELKKRRAESSWKMAGQPKQTKAPSDEELMPVEEAKEIFDEVFEKARPLPTGKPHQRKIEPTPSDKPTVKPRLKTDPKARQTLAEQRGLAEERKTLHDVLKRDKGASDEEASEFLDSFDNIRNNAAEAGYAKNVEKYVKDKFDEKVKADAANADAEVKRLQEEAEANVEEVVPDFTDKQNLVRSRLEARGFESDVVDEAFARAKVSDPSKDFDPTTVNEWAKTVRKERMEALTKREGEVKAKADKALADEKKASVPNARKTLAQYVSDNGFDLSKDPNLQDTIDNALASKETITPAQVNGIKQKLNVQMRKLRDAQTAKIEADKQAVIDRQNELDGELEKLRLSESNTQAADIRKVVKEQEALDRELEALRIKEENAKTAELESQAKQRASEEAELDSLRRSESSKQVTDMENLRKEREAEKAKQDEIDSSEQSSKDLDEQIGQLETELRNAGADEGTIANVMLKHFKGKTSKLSDRDFKNVLTSSLDRINRAKTQADNKAKGPIQKKVSSMSDEALKGAGKSVVSQIIKGDSNGTRVVSEVVADTLKKRGMDRDAELISTVTEIMETAKERMKEFPDNPELWVSSEDAGNIQSIMSKREGGKEAGNVLVQLRTKLFGDKKIDHIRLSRSKIKEIIDNLRGAKEGLEEKRKTVAKLRLLPKKRGGKVKEG